MSNNSHTPDGLTPNGFTHTIGNIGDINFNLAEDVPRRQAVEVPRIAIDNALQAVYRQLLATGRRTATIETYVFADREIVKA